MTVKQAGTVCACTTSLCMQGIGVGYHSTKWASREGNDSKWCPSLGCHRHCACMRVCVCAKIPIPIMLKLRGSTPMRSYHTAIVCSWSKPCSQAAPEGLGTTYMDKAPITQHGSCPE